jgi:hypothetical protein
VFFRATEPQGQLTVRWGQSSDRQCLVHYSLPSLEHKRESPFIKAQALCSKPSVRPAALSSRGVIMRIFLLLIALLWGPSALAQEVYFPTGQSKRAGYGGPAVNLEHPA